MYDIIRPTPARLTPSGIQDLRCPLKFKTRQIDRQFGKQHDVPLPVAHGKAVHLVLHDLYADRRGGNLDVSNVEALVRGAVRATLYPRDINRDEQCQRVLAAVCAFVGADDYEDIEGVLALEQPGQFEVTVDGQLLCIVSATLDCTLVRASEPDTLVIRERKTTSQRIDLKEVYIMMRVARKCWPGYRKMRMEFDWLDGEGRVFRDVVTSSEIKGQHKIVLGMAWKVLKSNDYPACPGDACTFCPRRDTCQNLPPDNYTRQQMEKYSEFASDGLL